jgi:hypothetical protein
LSWLPTIQVVSGIADTNISYSQQQKDTTRIFWGLTRKFLRWHNEFKRFFQAFLVLAVFFLFLNPGVRYIIEDLTRTQSVELTTENIVEGRLVPQQVPYVIIRVTQRISDDGFTLAS